MERGQWRQEWKIVGPLVLLLFTLAMAFGALGAAAYTQARALRAQGKNVSTADVLLGRVTREGKR